MTLTFSQSEPNFVSDPIDISSDTILSLPETLPSLPSQLIKLGPTQPIQLLNLSNIKDIKLDYKFSYEGANGSLSYDLHDKNWIPFIEINKPSNCKANTKIKGYQEEMFLIGKFNWKNTINKNLKLTPCCIKESAYLVNMINDIAIRLYEHRQALFGSLHQLHNISSC